MNVFLTIPAMPHFTIPRFVCASVLRLGAGTHASPPSFIPNGPWMLTEPPASALWFPSPLADALGRDASPRMDKNSCPPNRCGSLTECLGFKPPVKPPRIDPGSLHPTWVRVRLPAFWGQVEPCGWTKTIWHHLGNHGNETTVCWHFQGSCGGVPFPRQRDSTGLVVPSASLAAPDK